MKQQQIKKERDRKDQRDPTDGPRAVPSVPAVASVPAVSSVTSSPSHFIPPHGGYQNLYSFQKAQIVYDATIYFCARFVEKRDRTYDQMVQAARSGKQNIVEGSQVSGTSKELELKLTNVARASLEELLTDYRDFLRARKLAEWPPDHPYTQRLRQLNHTPGANYETFRKGIEHSDPAICANVIIGLIKVTNFLLDRQIQALERSFLEHGGLREAMTRARVSHRAQQKRKT